MEKTTNQTKRWNHILKDENILSGFGKHLIQTNSWKFRANTERIAVEMHRLQ